jgi:hypothetical protein
VTFFKTKPGRVLERPVSDFVDSVLPLCAVTSSSDTFYFAQLQEEGTVLATVFRDSLIDAKFRKSAQPSNVHQSIDRVTRGPRQFYIILKRGEVRCLDLDGVRVKMSTNSSGSVYNFDRYAGDESDFASSFAEGGRVSVRKYPQLPITQIVPKQYGGKSLLRHHRDRGTSSTGATRRTLLMAEQKVPAPFDLIVLVVQSVECIILSTIPNDVRVNTRRSLTRGPALNLNCFALSKTPLEPFLVKRIQKIPMNVPICTPTYDSQFLLLRIVWSDIYSSPNFVDGDFGRLRVKDLIPKINGPRSVSIIW